MGRREFAQRQRRNCATTADAVSGTCLTSPCYFSGPCTQSTRRVSRTACCEETGKETKYNSHHRTGSIADELLTLLITNYEVQCFENDYDDGDDNLPASKQCACLLAAYFSRGFKMACFRVSNSQFNSTPRSERIKPPVNPGSRNMLVLNTAVSSHSI